MLRAFKIILKNPKISESISEKKIINKKNLKSVYNFLNRILIEYWQSNIRPDL